MKFVSFPQQIEAIRYAPNVEFPSFVKLRAFDGAVQVYNPAHSSWISVKDGDWIRIDNPGDVYPITNDYMKSKYRAIEG